MSKFVNQGNKALYYSNTMIYNGEEYTFEEFKHYKNPKYLVGNYGTVISLKTKDTIGTLSEYGYRNCFIDGKWRAVHRMVYETFIGEIPAGMEINHRNMIRRDNRLENLELVTRMENIHHARSMREEIKKINKTYPIGRGKWTATRTFSDTAKANMLKAAARGIKHHNWKGFYEINGTKYTTFKEAVISSGIDGSVLRSWIKKEKEGYKFIPVSPEEKKKMIESAESKASITRGDNISMKYINKKTCN